MIRTHVKEICERRGITTAYQLQKALEISPSVAARLMTDDYEFISKTTLDNLCRVLKCKPGQLITYEADEKE